MPQRREFHRRLIGLHIGVFALPTRGRFVVVEELDGEQTIHGPYASPHGANQKFDQLTAQWSEFYSDNVIA